MKLEVGKRYVLRNGYITNVIQENSHSEYAFKDGSLTWKASGEYSIIGALSPLDIVSEYIEKDAEMKPDKPQQPLRWVENCKPDKPGIWAYRGFDGVAVADILTAKDIAGCRPDTRCYLGPIPEILPPKRKVVERLWVNADYEDGTGVLHWQNESDGDGIPSGAGYWIRTDRTRTREI